MGGATLLSVYNRCTTMYLVLKEHRDKMITLQEYCYLVFTYFLHS